MVRACQERERCPEWSRKRADILSRTLPESPAERCQTGLEIAADPRKTIAALALHGVPASNGRRQEKAVLARVVTWTPISSPEPETARFDIRL
jgi:hypothetical protein